MNHSDIQINTNIDESWAAYHILQKTKNTISNFFKECGDNYPMILIPSKMSIVLNDINGGEDRYTCISDIMDHLITKYGRNKDILKRDWDLYRKKPRKPYLNKPNKKTPPKKREIEDYIIEKVEVTRPSGCFSFYLIVFFICIVIALFSKDYFWLPFYLLTFIPVLMLFISETHSRYFNTKTVRKVRQKNRKQIEEEERIAEAQYNKELKECEKWNSQVWPQLVTEAEKKYQQEMEEYPITLERWERYWQDLPDLIETEYKPALTRYLFNSINFNVKYEEEENPRRGAMEDKYLMALKNCGVKKINRDISVDEYYPDFSIIDKYYFVDIEIDEPYIYETGEPIHYIGSNDDIRNEEFQKLGAFVIRFSEDQVRHSIDTCTDIIKYFQKFAETGDITNLEKVVDLSSKIRQKRWTKNKAKIMATYRYRDK